MIGENVIVVMLPEWRPRVHKFYIHFRMDQVIVLPLFLILCLICCWKYSHKWVCVTHISSFFSVRWSELRFISTTTPVKCYFALFSFSVHIPPLMCSPRSPHSSSIYSHVDRIPSQKYFYFLFFSHLMKCNQLDQFMNRVCGKFFFKKLHFS